MSTVINWETLATDFLESLESFLERITFPGASDNPRFEVMTTAITVLIRLRLKSSDCMINNGRLYPGSDAEGAGSVAHHISPRSITTRPFPKSNTEEPEIQGLDKTIPLHRSYSIFP